MSDGTEAQLDAVDADVQPDVTQRNNPGSLPEAASRDQGGTASSSATFPAADRRRAAAPMKYGAMKTRTGRVLNGEEFAQSLQRLTVRPTRLPVETFCNFPQVPKAHLSPEALQASVERLAAPAPEHANEQPRQRAQWLRSDVRFGKFVDVLEPWKATTAAEQTTFCNSMYEKHRVHAQEREQRLLEKYCAPLGKGKGAGDAAAEVKRFQTTLLRFYGPPGAVKRAAAAV